MYLIQFNNRNIYSGLNSQIIAGSIEEEGGGGEGEVKFHI